MGSFVITVAQQKGGAGKTTIAVHLSVALSQRGYRVGLIDIDPQGSLSKWHSIREERFGKEYTGIRFSTITGWRVANEVAKLQKDCDMIIIDSPPHVQTESRTAIRHADLVLVPVQPSPTDLWATQATLDYAKAEKVPVHIIMNRVNSQSRIFQVINEQLRNSPASVIGNRVLFASSLLDGLGVTEIEPYSHAASEIKSLAADVSAYFGADIRPSEPMISDAASDENVSSPSNVTNKKIVISA